MKADERMDRVNDLADWLEEGDEGPADPPRRNKLAAALVRRGIPRWRRLDSIDPESLQAQNPAEVASLRRATAKAARHGQTARPMQHG